MRKFTYEHVKEYFEKQGCELLEKEYVNNRTKMRYKCHCGDISEIRFENFKKDQRCKKCGYKINSDKRKHTLKYVKNYFKERKCELLEKEYINCMTKNEIQM